MRWSELHKLSDSQFQRLVGVKRLTFNKMIESINSFYRLRSKKSGRPSKLSVEDKLLIMLMYYREYRPFFHVAVAFGISEAQCWRVVRKLEEILISSKLFHLPGKKKLEESKSWEVIVVDVGESPIERPKKNNASSIQAKRSDTR